MKCLNEVNLIGYLGGDPDFKHTTSGKSVVQLNVAVNKKFKDQSGNTIESVEWVKVIAWQKLADICKEYLKKGSRIFIKGELKTETYDKNGETRYSTKVIARDLIMLDSAKFKQPETSEVHTEEEVLPF